MDLTPTIGGSGGVAAVAPPAAPLLLGNQTCIVVFAHDFVFDVVETVQDTSTDELVRNVTPYGVLAASLVLCFFGYYALRCVVAIAAFGAGVVGTVRLLNASNELAVSCDVATLAVVVGGGISALVAVLMTRVVSTLLGAAAACVVVAAVFATCGAVCDVDLWPGVPRFLGLTLVPFWAGMAVAGVVGALVARRRHREMLTTFAALVGGFGVAVSMRAIVVVEDHAEFPHWLFFGTFAASAGAGLATQYWWVKRRQTRRRRKRNETHVQKKADASSSA